MKPTRERERAGGLRVEMKKKGGEEREKVNVLIFT